MTSTPHDQPAFWRLTITALLEQIGSDPSGLTSRDAATRLTRFGPNKVHAEKTAGVLLQYLTRFRNPLVIILLVASAVLALTGDFVGFSIISTIILISVTLDFVQEHRAGEAADRLRRSVAVRVQVLRDGKSSDLAIENLVPGDVVLLAAGDMVPCDGRILEANDFFLNQGLLTGESYPVEKRPGELPEEKDLLSAGNAVLMGTSVISGSARVLVVPNGRRYRLRGDCRYARGKTAAHGFRRGHPPLRSADHASHGPSCLVCPADQPVLSSAMA